MDAAAIVPIPIVFFKKFLLFMKLLLIIYCMLQLYLSYSHSHYIFDILLIVLKSSLQLLCIFACISPSRAVSSTTSLDIENILVITSFGNGLTSTLCLLTNTSRANPLLAKYSAGASNALA